MCKCMYVFMDVMNLGEPDKVRKLGVHLQKWRKKRGWMRVSKKKR